MSHGVLGRLLEALWQLPPAVSGGLAGFVTGPLGVYLLNLWRNRPRLRLRILEESFDGKSPFVRIEVETLGDDTSLEPDLTMAHYTARTRTRTQLRAGNRRLRPQTAATQGRAGPCLGGAARP